jgi:hypothetical protein
MLQGLREKGDHLLLPLFREVDAVRQRPNLIVGRLLRLAQANDLLNEQLLVALEGIDFCGQAAVGANLQGGVVVGRRRGTAPARAFPAGRLAAVDLVQQIATAAQEILVGKLPAVRIDLAKALQRGEEGRSAVSGGWNMRARGR